MTSVRNIYFVPLGDAVPQLVATTFEIGVRERRDILFLSFRDIPDPRSPEDEPWEHIPERQVILRWLDDNGVGWEVSVHSTTFCRPAEIRPTVTSHFPA